MKLGNWASLLSSKNIEATLLKDKMKCEQKDMPNMWYHGKLQRAHAEQILEEEMKRNHNLDSNGLFLVRDSTQSEVDFTLSFLFEKHCYHFFIQRSKEGFYFIEGGPVVHGLEKLVELYIQSESRLPCPLTHMCRRDPPPPNVRRDGPTNILHRVISEDSGELAIKILKHPNHPHVDAKNEEGSTALHEAAFMGMDSVVSELLKLKANVKIKDLNGDTPLHRACEANQIYTALLLINDDKTCLQERNHVNNWVPLHIAALYGHTDSVQILLNGGAALYPRTAEGETPIELAEKYGRKDCIDLLKNFKETSEVTQRIDWFHPELDREGANHLLHGHTHITSSGLFLIRPSRTKDGHFVLSLMKDQMVFHFEIKNMEYRGETLYYIDDCPLHMSLESLVQHHHRFEDGLGVPLTVSVSTKNVLKELAIYDTNEYMTFQKSTVSSSVSNSDEYKPPELPPRPSKVDSTKPTDATPPID